MPPLQTVGYDYLVTAPSINISTTKARMVRVVATQPNTTITYDPPQAGAPTTLVNAGDYLEISQTMADFMIMADQKVLVAEYMLGQAAGGGTGDPAMTLAVAVLQYRSDYLFHAPTNYEANYVNITALTGATVTSSVVERAHPGTKPIDADSVSFVAATGIATIMFAAIMITR